MKKILEIIFGFIWSMMRGRTPPPLSRVLPFEKKGRIFFLLRFNDIKVTELMHKGKCLF
jgi:hypothetical protein